jgi:hypothetical protein
MPTLYAPAWRDHTSDFISFGVRLASEALRLLQRWGKQEDKAPNRTINVLLGAR